MSTDRGKTMRGVAVAGGLGLLLWLLLGRGGGKGDKGGGAAPARCRLRLTGAGLTLEGVPTVRPAAVAACKERGGGAELRVTGDAVVGEREALRAELESAGVETWEEVRP